ncbi:MAG: transketolase [Deltaproteobacteria bacterium RBG_13_43_22]|nr:MAG: transketolase [Deltaproteobacteria bacterium RBG_13_43_22]
MKEATQLNNVSQPDALDDLCINTIRMLAVDAVQKANSGHPGMPMGAAPMAYILWTRFLKHNPRNPHWPDRDRFVLSAGHGSMLLYGLLHLTGYDLSLDDLKAFRQWGSKTPGHPEYGHTPGVETTTGPLGQGFANGVGMAMAERFLAARYNRPDFPLVDHYTYAIVSDGDLMEGISHEVASLAGHLKLGKLIYLYDDNHISIEGSTDITFTENRLARFKAYNWHVQQVADGNDVQAIRRAIRKARTETERPSLIAVRTCIGCGSPNKENTAGAHGEPLGLEEVRLTKESLGWPTEPNFYVPQEAQAVFRKAVKVGEKNEKKWKNLFAAYEKAYPGPAAEWKQVMAGDLSEGWEQGIPVFPADSKGMATRAASGKVLNALAGKVTNLIGGSADLAPSNKTEIKDSKDFQAGTYDQRNVRFGVREHGMGSIMNGMALHGGVIPYGGTFLIFSEYMRPAIRLAAMMGLRVIYVFTHDSIGLGEDGPTHQPVEQLAALRVIPNLTVIRPADANETAEAWRIALKSKNGPTALILTRQNLPTLDRNLMRTADNLALGAYVLNKVEGPKPELVLLATGSEISIALEAMNKLIAKGIFSRVVSMPSWELFERQSQEYHDRVIPPEIKARLAIEAGSSLGWRQYVGEKGIVIGLDHFGASAPDKVLYEKFGLTADQIVEKALELLKDLNNKDGEG